MAEDWTPKDNWSPNNHDHDNVYSKLGHVHDYAASDHNHDGAYSKLGHTHPETVGYPNYAEVVNLGELSSWTATGDGWVSLTHYAQHIVWEVYVNGVLIGVEGGEETQSGLSFLPVTRGDIVATTKRGDSSSPRTVTYRFFPKK